jgi:hypothetical protein
MKANEGERTRSRGYLVQTEKQLKTEAGAERRREGMYGDQINSNLNMRILAFSAFGLRLVVLPDVFLVHVC